MTYGITGNTTKETLWEPVADLVGRLRRADRAFCLSADVARGLAERGLVEPDVCGAHETGHVAGRSDVVLSFGGDGTLLRTAHEADRTDTPILGVNIGRLGFLTKIEVGELPQTVERLHAGDWGVERRSTLAVEVEGARFPELPTWALNDVVFDKSGTTSMIQIEAAVDGAHLNTYWADGLVIATPTGSTAYALSVGGPILVPATGAVVVAPIAPHTLTARPIVLPASARLTLRVTTRGHPYAFACDGTSVLVETNAVTVRVGPSPHAVPLVTLPDRDYFGTIRDKLKWGQGGVF